MLSKLNKFLLSLVCLGGIFGMTACETAEHNATIPADQCEVRIVEDSMTGDKTAVVVLGIKNDTIYNINAVELHYAVYYEDAPVPGLEHVVERVDLDFKIRHGVRGYISYTVPVDAALDADYVKILKETHVIGYDSLWQTYMAPFIIAIVISGIALIFFAIEIFAKGLTKEDVQQMFKDKLASMLVTFGLLIIICLIPLMFSTWVVTLILLGGFIGTALLSGAMTLIKLVTLKK